MAPKKAKTATKARQAPQVGEETAPMSLDDLPNDVLGIILSKLTSSKDKLRLTQASPSVRRLCTGPHAHPSVLGSLALAFWSVEQSEENAPKPLRLKFDSRIDGNHFDIAPDFLVWIDSEHKGCKKQAGALLSWIESHALAFKDITLAPAIDDDDGVPSAALSLSILKSVPASFHGPLKLSLCALFASETVAQLRPVFDLISSRFASNKNELLIANLEFETPEVCSLFREISSFKKLSFVNASGKVPSDAFSKCAPIDSLFLDAFVEEEDEDFAPSYVACSSFKTIETLEIRQAGSPRSCFNFSVFLSADFSSLQSVILNPVFEDELPKLSALESLPNLLFLSLFLKFHRESPKTSALNSKLLFSLPNLTHLSVGFYFDLGNFSHNVAHKSTPAGQGQPWSVALPLSYFSCPNLRVLEVFSKVWHPKGFISVSFDSLARLPSLTCLRIHCFPRVATFKFALSSDQVQHNPLLSFVSVKAVAFEKRQTSLSVDLPLPLILSTEGKETKSSGMYVKRLDFGDRRVLEDSDSEEVGELSGWPIGL